MNDTPHPEMDRLQELLADQAVFGLEPDEQAELNTLLAAATNVDAESLDRTAAMTWLSMMDSSTQALPKRLEAGIRSQAASVIGAGEKPTGELGDEPPGHEDAHSTGTSVDAADVLLPPPVPRARARWPEYAAWTAAFAAVLVGVIMAVQPIAPVSGGVASWHRKQMLKSDADVLQLDWQRGQDTTGRMASGNIVWSNSQQKGYMLFKDLAANDPTQEQYQLWIFDAKRDEKRPVDGGVFDIPAGQDEVVIPIRAKLPIDTPTLFAITVEKPGGVEVSTRERLPLLAPL